MNKISTGELSNLKTYRKIALILSGGNEKSEAVVFFDKKIKESPRGKKEEVWQDERQMIHLIYSMVNYKK